MSITTEPKHSLIEDILKHSYKYEQAGRQPTLESIAGALHIRPDEVNLLVSKMMERHLLLLVDNTFRLTPAGQEYALQVIRAHRLWERYLADETGVAETDWHNEAERHEHHLSVTEVETLAARLGHPTHDPHGDPIPMASGVFVPHGGQPLVTLEPGNVARIVHLEDEPPMVYAQLVAEDLHPGMRLQLTEKSDQRLRFRTEGGEHTLAPLLARNISVIPLPSAETVERRPQERLSGLKVGQAARVVTISPACRGAERRRLLDLGILPGTLVKAEMVSPSGDPTAYLIRQSLIGLRKEQADLIYITHDLNPSTTLEVN
jgi:DtxR family Mn-dependent transcriptional regulator